MFSNLYVTASLLVNLIMHKLKGIYIYMSLFLYILQCIIYFTGSIFTDVENNAYYLF